jgi:hypothetical protein
MKSTSERNLNIHFLNGNMIVGVDGLYIGCNFVFVDSKVYIDRKALTHGCFT